jgi:toxin ParE1/3/4
MGRVLKTPEAELDLIDIWLHISEDSVRAADAVWARFEEKFALLSDHPLIGPAREELGAGLRSFPVDNYLVFYRPLVEGDGVALLRVIHGARDLRRLFFRR